MHIYSSIGLSMIYRYWLKIGILSVFLISFGAARAQVDTASDNEVIGGKGILWTCPNPQGEAPGTGLNPSAACSGVMTYTQKGITYDYLTIWVYTFVSCGPINYGDPNHPYAHCTSTGTATEYFNDGTTRVWHDIGQSNWPVYGTLSNSCPSGSTKLNSNCYCNDGFSPSKDSLACVPLWENFKVNKSPRCGETTDRPIVKALGVKRKRIKTGLEIGGLPIDLNYNSSPILVPTLRRLKAHAFPFWRLSIVPSIYRSDFTGMLSAIRGDGSSIDFQLQGGVFVADGDVVERLVANGNNLLLYSGDGAIEKYDQEGRILNINMQDGRQIAYTYSDASTPSDIASLPGLLIRIADNFQGEVSMRYDAAGKLISLSGRGAQDIVLLTYDEADRLSVVTFQDSSSWMLKYANPAYPTALSGILFEDGVSYANYAYDASGRAAVSLLKGLPGTLVTFDTPVTEAVTKTFIPGGALKVREWVGPVSVSVTEPNGAVSHQDFQLVGGYPRIKSVNQPAGSGCLATTRTQADDVNGNADWREDFNGHRTCYVNDLSRNLETSRVEGLAAGSACAGVVPAGSVLPVTARRFSTQWHPVWRKRTKLAEPRRVTTNVYNGQPDPFSGGATAWCAPSSATLLDGSPIVVLCKQVEQATTDANGAQGFAATVDSAVPARVQQWTYNEYGQVLTSKDPLNNTTTNTYYDSTTADHTKGDLATVTNALNQKVSYTKYNPAGQWLEMVDANTITTTRTFDLRQRLKTVSTAGATTSYDYWPTGLLKTVTLPDTSAVNYGYDDSHRLTSVTDHLGNKIVYTLDNSGNRTAENVTDPSGKLAKTLTRVPDALNRIQQISGRE